MSQNSSALFQNYEQDYDNICSSIASKFKNHLPEQTGGTLALSFFKFILPLEPRKATIRALERELEEAQEIVCTSRIMTGLASINGNGVE